jgi:hypothetical protein
VIPQTVTIVYVHVPQVGSKFLKSRTYAFGTVCVADVQSDLHRRTVGVSDYVR